MWQSGTYAAKYGLHLQAKMSDVYVVCHVIYNCKTWMLNMKAENTFTSRQKRNGNKAHLQHMVLKETTANSNLWKQLPVEDITYTVPTNWLRCFG